jgi:hypothetical protein
MNRQWISANKCLRQGNVLQQEGKLAYIGDPINECTAGLQQFLLDNTCLFFVEAIQKKLQLYMFNRV